jgi:hypothetical protein
MTAQLVLAFGLVLINFTTFAIGAETEVLYYQPEQLHIAFGGKFAEGIPR